MDRRGLIGSLCVWAAMPAVSFSGEAPPGVMPFRILTPPNTSAAETSGGVTLRQALTAAHDELRQALITNDLAALLKLYREDVTSLPDQQPALYGKPAISAWHQALLARRRITGYAAAIREVFNFGDSLMEYGDFTLAWQTSGGETQEAAGKYLHVWAVEPAGRLSLQADVRNWAAPRANPGEFFVDLPQTPAPVVVKTDAALEAELKALNDRNATAVKTHDTETRIAFYADDAIIMPINVPPKIGMAEIRPYLSAYVANGMGATFDRVMVSTVGFDDLGHGYVREYFKFHVDWRAGEGSGTVTGGGIRLWRRQPDGKLKILREIGTHDYRV